MRTSYFIQATIFSLMVFLAACGGDKPTTETGASSSSSGTNTSSGTSSSVAATAATKIGLGSGTAFSEGLVGIGIGTSTLSAGGATELTVNLVTAENILASNSLSVTFTSTCFTAGNAVFKSGSTTTNKVTSAEGEAVITYQANGCSGNDSITASVAINGVARTATGTINIAPDTVTAIETVSVVPTAISLKGTGGKETSTVTFRVTGATGSPVRSATVDFSLNSTAGGLSLASASAVTDSKGEVTATVQAGSIPTNVNVTATARGYTVSTQSNDLIVSTGIPDQNSFSLSIETYNPAGWEKDGVEVDVVIRLADAFNNFVPDNTAVYFTASGAGIDSSCKTVKGTCKVKWVSQKERPSDGRVVIRATTEGNESFIDGDGDGYYSPGKDIFRNTGDCSSNVPKTCDDLIEAYMDKNRNNLRESNEEYVDYNNNIAFDAPNGIYNGVLCKTEGNGCTKTGVTIRDDALIVMSSVYPYLTAGLLPGQPQNINVGANATKSEVLELGDILGNSMPVGAKISIVSDITNGSVSHNFPSAGVPATNVDPMFFTVTVKSSVNTAASGSFYINVTSEGTTTATAVTTINSL
jgi:hypothetical protein